VSFAGGIFNRLKQLKPWFAIGFYYNTTHL
jgi:hypothetical protein